MALRPLPRTFSSTRNVPNATSYQGAYGTYVIGQEDEREVLLYRSGINLSAATSVLASATAFFPDEQALHNLDLNVLTLLFSGGLLLSLTQIHIYVDPLKKFLWFLWATGFLGTLFLMCTEDSSVPVFVAANPWAVWLVGPMFASLTGVAFKEGLCYGKAEAAGLFGATPLLLLSHLSSLVDAKGELGLLAAFEILLAVFALRKWTQATKDDVGDKSVFDFLKLSPEEQEIKRRERYQREAFIDDRAD